MTAVRSGAEEPTRRRILDVALELFAAQGFAATSTRELSERLGFTKAALYYHFRSKDELLDALVAPVMAQLEGLVSVPSAPHAIGDLERQRLLSGYLDLIIEHRRLLAVLVQDPSAGARPALAPGRGLFERLVQLLAASATPSPEQRAQIRFVLGGLHTAVLFAHPDDDVVRLREVALEAARIVLGLPVPIPAQR